MNLKNFASERVQMDGGIGSGQPPGNYQLARQGSIYSLTFDELQSTIGGVGKDFGSMNMDELLKNIWNAEETQTMVNNNNNSNDHGHGGGGGGGGVVPTVGYLQRQGSLTLPRTLSQKTVDEVWKDISKEYNSGFGESSFQDQQRQQTLGEMTLEEFLVKAGVVREEAQQLADADTVKQPPLDNGLFGNLLNSHNNSSFSIGFQQPIRIPAPAPAPPPPENGNNDIAFHHQSAPLSHVNGVVRSTQQHQNIKQQQQIFPKQPTLAYGLRGGIMGHTLTDPVMKGNLVSNGGGMGHVTTAANGSPALSSDGIGKSNGDTSSVSPAPYVFNGVLRGRKCSAVEKVVERRQRRMIKNRESAARSRARKQAYTMELEAEVAKLKEHNQELLKKQEEILEMQKNQEMEMMNMEKGAKRRCLRRTQTGPW